MSNDQNWSGNTAYIAWFLSLNEPSFLKTFSCCYTIFLSTDLFLKFTLCYHYTNCSSVLFLIFTLLTCSTIVFVGSCSPNCSSMLLFVLSLPPDCSWHVIVVSFPPYYFPVLFLISPSPELRLNFTSVTLYWSYVTEF